MTHNNHSNQTEPAQGSNKTIFIIEDDEEIARIVSHALKEFGFHTEHFRTGATLQNRLRSKSPDLCIVDLQLPDIDGTQLVRALQDKCDCGILILTGRHDISDRVLGLELGADDYMPKPFEPRELVARVRSILRRYERSSKTSDKRGPIARFAGWTFDTGNHNLTSPTSEDISLSTAEAHLLHLLLQNTNRLLTRDQLMRERGMSAFDRSIDVRISRLRRKIEPDPQNPSMIKTVYGAGYLMCTTVEWE